MSGGAVDEAEDHPRGRNIFGEATSAGVDLNLTALMDILSNLLFFLLASFGATIVMVINTTVPVQSADKSDMASTKQAITLVVKLTQAGLEVSATGSAQTPEELTALGARFANAGEAPDYAKFTEHLVGIKQKYPKSETMILIPEPGTRYEGMVRTMDAAREKEVKAGGKIRLVRLFPNVVVSTVVK